MCIYVGVCVYMSARVWESVCVRAHERTIVYVRAVCMCGQQACPCVRVHVHVSLHACRHWFMCARREIRRAHPGGLLAAILNPCTKWTIHHHSILARLSVSSLHPQPTSSNDDKIDIMFKADIKLQTDFSLNPQTLALASHCHWRQENHLMLCVM